MRLRLRLNLKLGSCFTIGGVCINRNSNRQEQMPAPPVGKTHRVGMWDQRNDARWTVTSAKGMVVRLLVAVVMIALLVAPGSAWAARTWSQVAEDTNAYLEQAGEVYSSGDSKKAKALVDEGYFGPFESEGMEATIRSYISAQRAFEIEQEFKHLKMLMAKGGSPSEVNALVAKLSDMLKEDAAMLDGGGATEAGSAAPLVQSLIIILREGFEAILILSAIIAYLVKSGNRDKVRTIYSGALAALLASAVTAVILRIVFAGMGAFGQELLEGVTMLVAVAVLFWVSFWLIGKAHAQKWQEYVHSKVSVSLTKGNTLALAVVAFLSVYREGAETILFYEALVAGNPTSTGPIVLGFFIGVLALIGVFLILRYGSLRIPIKQFFTATSALLYLMAFIFAGNGMREIQETGLIGSTVINGIPVIDTLGIYPTWETLLPQLVLALIAIGGIIWQFTVNGKKVAAPRS